MRKTVNLNLMKIFRQNFGVKVFAAFTICMFVISFSFTALLFFQQRKSLTDILTRSGELLARVLAHNSRIGVFAENEELLRDPVEGVFQQEEVLEVSIFSLRGDLLVKREKPGTRTPEKPARGDGKRKKEIFEKLKAPGPPFYIEGKSRFEFWSPIVSGSSYLMEEPLFFEEPQTQRKDRIIGFVKITVGKVALNKQLNDLLFKSVLIGIVFLITGSGVLYVVVKGITRPLDRLTEGVKTLGMKGVLEKVPVETADEIGRLAVAFNDLSESLKRREAEKRQLEDQLRHVQKMEAIGTLAGGIAHDFNNILAVIMGYIELAFLDIPEGTQLRHRLEEVIKASNRAKDLVKQILAFSRHSKPEKKPIQIGVVVKEAMSMLQASLPSTIDIRQDITIDDTARVLCDPTQIHQVLMNLCTNAAHSMRDHGGVLHVSLTGVEIDSDSATKDPDLTPGGRYQRLTVSDTGQGISREVMERIFDPFFTTKGPGEGTGMGLAVVHGIVKGLNGVTTVDSEPGKGTTFQLFFPTIKSDAIIVESMQSGPPVRGDECILFVDDEEALVDTGRQMLERLGYQVVPITSSTEALEVFGRQPDKFDLVITDMTMPNMTGAELAGEIMRIRPDIPVILLTGFSDMISKEYARTIGIREFVMKPVISREMVGIIRRILDQEEGEHET